ncbi:MAG: putative DNA helicase ino80 [Candelaria pacifica]|nr:MAG: putative DNA helicase ino80 [Candelaria pacifica]
MYQNTVLHRPQDEEEDRLRRESIGRSNQLPPYTARSPTQPNFNSYSPTNGSHRQTFDNRYHPPTPAPLPLPPTVARSPQVGPPPPLTTNGLTPLMGPAFSPRDKAPSTYYDPTSDHAERSTSRSRSHYSRQSPVQNRESFHYPENPTEPNFYNSTHHSPGSIHYQIQSPSHATSHSHPSGRLDSISQSPVRAAVASPTVDQEHIGITTLATALSMERPGSQEAKTKRSSDPMAFSSILTSSNSEPLASPSLSRPSPKEPRKSVRTSVKQPAPLVEEPPVRASPRRVSDYISTPTSDRPVKSKVNGDTEKDFTRPIGNSKGHLTNSDKENDTAAALAKIDATDVSDIEGSGFEDDKARYVTRSNKRSLDVEELESGKRKRRRTALTKKLSDQLGRHAQSGKERFTAVHENDALAEVQQQEVWDEKERKKDMQRKRRREKTVLNEVQKSREAADRAQNAADDAEREKFTKEALRAEKKAKATKLMLQRGDGPKETRDATPIAPNLEGGMMSSFPTVEPAVAEPPKKKTGKGGTRPKKSKEKKQAEKDAAEAAHAAMENNEPITIAPKDENRRDMIKREPKEPKDAKEVKEVKEVKEMNEVSPSPGVTQYVSKGYNQIYDQIWRDIARKDIPRVYRIKEASYSTKQSNLRKTAQLASKEARRWQLRTNKSMKDVQARAKRGMREMMSFWKRNEREERDMRRVAEKHELENAKKAEADREANRQKRKLNFLISQTELYSHFIGRKIKTDEVERSTDTADVSVSQQTVAPAAPSAHSVALPDSVGQLSTKVTNFEDLDFDAEDESVLRQAAMANAQSAVQEAQDRARAFNNAGDDQENGQTDFDEGEMNFQNPTSLGDMDVAQPKMLNAQLKEYQLKGLNWLVNLYEQGINGILADEMGLGKTVQSISVMGYLAEKHNIWGPFLVIAPASTLHNWQQEITRFVPDLKVLPYWGNAKDRKVLRKFWDRKHITYTQDSPFHVLVTSYQLVVQDTQYFQKIRWQYMILDEAQAIKSSQSSRWKSLLGFHCRNRLLLTGTPIQNNMQELWALLHFIMPSLFDSHDEFSDWFSKDIESHAQSNTKLNEDQLKRLHMILKPFMLRRIKKHVQKELGDKIEEDVFCDLTYRQRAYYGNLRNRISIMDLIEKAAVGDDQDTATLMNLVMQFRKVCNHPDLFERAETTSPLSFAYFAETASFLREGQNINVAYSTRNLVEYRLPRLIYSHGGRLDTPGHDNPKAGFRHRYLNQLMNIWTPENIERSTGDQAAFSWLRFTDTCANDAAKAFHQSTVQRAADLVNKSRSTGAFEVLSNDSENDYLVPPHAIFKIADRNPRKPLAEVTNEGYMHHLLNISNDLYTESGLNRIEPCARPAASAPPVDLVCSSQGAMIEKQQVFFNVSVRRVLYGLSEYDEQALLDSKVEPALFPVTKMLPSPISEKARYTKIQVPSMRRFVTDSGKLAKLDQLLRQLKNGGHRVLLYFQMTRMIDLMEEYLTYRNYKYLRLDGSTKLEDRRDTVHDFQTRPEIFVFLLSTRAGGLGINLTAADTVIFYDSDWNPTIDSQAMDRAHRLGQTRQVTVYRMITRGTIEERIRKRALQKEEVQRVVISGGSGAGVDFNTRSRENRTKDIAMWLADDDQAAAIEKKEAEIAAAEAKEPAGKKKASKKRKADVSLDEMYHEGEGHFDDGSSKPSGAATPISAINPPSKGKKATGKGKGTSKKAKTAKERLRMVDGDADPGVGEV